MKKVFIWGLMVISLLSACTNSDELPEVNNSKPKSEQVSSSKSEDLQHFAQVLSKLTFQHQNLRQLLKEKAVQQFDYNYDVLYYPIRNEKIEGSKTLRQLLIEESSADFIDEIENNIPLLNIFIPKISELNVYPEKLDITDNELPVAVNGEKGTDLYLNGTLAETLEEGEVPGFNVIVVNENIRVKPTSQSPSRSATGEKWSFQFKSPNFDNTAKSRATATLPEGLYATAIKAYEAGFNRNDNSDYQTAYQRDYIYYSITPTQKSGALNRSVSEYLSFIEVDKNLYWTISDQRAYLPTDDPYIQVFDQEIYSHDCTEEELKNILWTSGTYNFVFEILSSASNMPTQIYIPLTPEQLWDFNIIDEYRHHTAFRRSKHTYRINPSRFTSKRHYFEPGSMSLGQWDLANEGLQRYISIFESDDNGLEIHSTATEKRSFKRVTNVKGEFKIGLGSKDSPSSVGGNISDETTSTKEYEYTFQIIKREHDDPIATRLRINYYESIIEGKNSDGSYRYREYNTGGLKFGIDVR